MFKRIFVLFMTVVLVFSFSLPAFAIENNLGIINEIKIYDNPNNENEYFIRVVLIESRRFDTEKEISLYRIKEDGKELIKTFQGDGWGSIEWDQTFDRGSYAFLPVEKTELNEGETYSISFPQGAVVEDDVTWNPTPTVAFEPTFTYEEMLDAVPCLGFETAEVEATETIDFSPAVIYPPDFDGEVYLSYYENTDERNMLFSVSEECTTYVNLRNKETEEIYGTFRVNTYPDEADSFGELLRYTAATFMGGGVDLVFDGGSLLAGSLYAMVLPFLMILAIPLSVLGF